MQDKSRYNLFYRSCASILILLHVFTFGPIREAAAFSSSSASYKLTSGALNEGGKGRIPKGPAYTKLLTHLDGLLGATTFRDETGHTITVYGNTQIDTAQSKFGGASAVFAGNGDYLSLADSDDWNFGTGDFTIDFWVRFNGVASRQEIMGQYVDANNQWTLAYTGSALTFTAVSGGVDKITQVASTVLSINLWYHIAGVRYGNNFSFYVNGISLGTTTIGTMPDLAASLWIGKSGDPGYFNGWLDELRVSKGIARWTANFTPSQAPYSIDEPGNANLVKLWQDTLGEPAIGRSTSPSYILNSGFISTAASNPPAQTQIIPNQAWPENASKLNAFDLDDYFSSDTGGFTYTVSGNSQIAVSIDSATNKVSFSQAQNWLGTEKIKFTATDSEGNSIQSNEITLQVEGVNNPPVLNYIPDITVNETELITITPSATDLDGDLITYSFSSPLDINGQWQTDYFSAGTYTVTVIATDSTGLTDTQAVVINVRNINRPPILNPITDITVNEGDLVTISPVVSDPDSDAFSIYYSVPLDSSGKWLTGYDDAGIYTVTATASDGIDTVSQAVKITVNNTNRAPQAALTLSKYTVNPNETISITLSAFEPDGDNMSFSLKKDGSEFTSGNLNSTYTITTSFASAGDHIISTTVTDSGGLTSTDSKGVDVVDPNADRDYINPVMGDFNGDALSDLGLHNSQNGTWEICISDAGVFRNAVDWLAGFGASGDWWPIGGDFNGDGRTDIGVYNNTNGQLQIALSTGSSFTSQSTLLTADFASYSWQPFTGNFNADKYTDFALYNKDTGEVKVALGKQSGFGSFNSWLNNFGADYIAMAGDFNADSLTDLCLFKKSTGEFKVAFSNSKEFVDGAGWLSGFAVDEDSLLADFNNDGLTDIGYWDKTSGSWYYAVSTGSSFVNKGAWLFGFGTELDESASTGDFDGNGVSDAATFDKDQIGINRWRTRLSTDKPADLLTAVDNGIGGRTQITYTYAAKSENASLPFPVYVASVISLSNIFPAGRAATYTQNFTFSGGYYDASEREFRGFAKVKAADPITNNFSETYFYQGKPGQDGALKGQIEKIISFDGNNRKISETLNAYEVRKAGPQERVLGAPFLIEQTTTVWEENAVYLTTKDKFTYDNIGNIIVQLTEGDAAKAGDEKTTATVYAPAYENGFNRPLEATLKDKDANVVSRKTFEYDIKGNLTKDTVWIFDPLTSIASHPSSLYSYDSFGNLTSTTNALGATVTTEYETDFYAYPIRVTNSLGHTIQYVYESKFGVVKSVADANGVTSTTTYDSLGRPIRVTKDDGRGTQVTAATYSYPDFNTKVSTNALGFSSTEYIDGLGIKYKNISVGEDGNLPRQVVSEVFFNSRGLTEKESLAHYIDEAASGISYIRYEYDIRGRIKKTISDFPGTSKDAESSINYLSPLYTETTDPQGHKKGSLKDVFGNIIEVTEFTQGGVYKTKYEYDIQGNLTQTTDSKGNITQIFYDSIGRKLRMLDADMGAWNYEYDTLGNLIKQTDAKGQVITFEYDSLNRLTKKTRDDGRGTRDEVNYFYDDTLKDNCIGRLSMVADLSGSTEFFYDNLGREIKSIKTINTSGVGEALPRGGIGYSVEREYDILDRLTKLTYPDGEIVEYIYDTNSGLLESVKGLSPQGTNPEPYVQDIIYNSQGQIKTIQYGNGTQTDYTYGQDLRLSRIFTRDDGRGTNLQDLHYLFDKNGNITTLTDNLRSNIRTYAYDDLDRLTQAQNVPDPAGGYTNFNYQYDSIGNMTYKSDVGVMTYGQGLSTQGTVPDKPHALTSAGGFTYQYDANGNMIVGKNKTLEYDIENRLIRVQGLSPQETVPEITTFLYDGDGGRVRKTTKGLSPQGTVPEESTTYIGSLYEVESDGTIRKHIFAGANRVCSVTKDEARETKDVSYYHSDHLGSSSVITDANGNQVEHYEYTPYGSLATQEIVSRPSSLIRHLYTGKELDSTGLYFYRARYYDPELGRFISADTIVQAPYDPQSLNRYSYCRNNPINYVDPTGHSWWKKFWGSIVGAVAGIVGTILTGGNMMVGFQIFNFFQSLQGAVNTGNWGGFAGGLAGGILGGMAGVSWATGIAKGLGESAYTFGGGFLIGAAEMGTAGFGGAFGQSLGSGESFGEAMKAGGIGFGIGAITGGLIEGSYLGGYQTFAHGMSVEYLAKQGVLPPVIPLPGAGATPQINPTVDAAAASRTSTRKFGWGRYLHGTDKGGALGISISRQLKPGSWVTLPDAFDPATGKIASALNPAQYQKFVGIPAPKGEFFADVLAPTQSVNFIQMSTGGAPEYQVDGMHIVTSVYANMNQ